MAVPPAQFLKYRDVSDGRNTAKARPSIAHETLMDDKLSSCQEMVISNVIAGGAFLA